MTTIERAPDMFDPAATDGIPYWWWLSFACEDTGKNLGVAIVFGVGVEGATEEAWRLGINPGGQVLGGAINPRFFESHIEPEWLNRLLSREEAYEIVADLNAS